MPWSRLAHYLDSIRLALIKPPYIELSLVRRVGWSHQSRQRRLLFFVTAILALVLLGQSLMSSGRWLNQPFPGFFIYQNLTVAPYSAPGWGGSAAGLQSLDRVVSVGGSVLSDRAELYDRVRSLPAGSIINYQVMRDSRRLDLTIASKNFTVRDWLLSFGIYIAIGLAFLVIGVVPYFYRAPSPVALPLCFMVMAVFVWFQTTFDFITDGWLPKEIRIFALCLTPSAAIHLALMLSRASTPNGAESACRGIGLCCWRSDRSDQ